MSALSGITEESVPLQAPALSDIPEESAPPQVPALSFSQAVPKDMSDAPESATPDIPISKEIQKIIKPRKPRKPRQKPVPVPVLAPELSVLIKGQVDLLETILLMQQAQISLMNEFSYIKTLMEARPSIRRMPLDLDNTPQSQSIENMPLNLSSNLQSENLDAMPSILGSTLQPELLDGMPLDLESILQSESLDDVQFGLENAAQLEPLDIASLIKRKPKSKPLVLTNSSASEVIHSKLQKNYSASLAKKLQSDLSPKTTTIPVPTKKPRKTAVAKKPHTMSLGSPMGSLNNICPLNTGAIDGALIEQGVNNPDVPNTMPNMTPHTMARDMTANPVPNMKPNNLFGESVATFGDSIPILSLRYPMPTMPLTIPEPAQKKQRRKGVKITLEGFKHEGWISPPRILLVDDNSVFVLLTGRLLTLLGCSFVAASDGVDAIDLYTSNRNFDIVFMDIIMPRLNGVEATQKIREFDQSIPIIAITDNFSDVECSMYLENGLNAVVAKPLSKINIISVIQQYVDSRSPRSARLIYFFFLKDSARISK